MADSIFGKLGDLGGLFRIFVDPFLKKGVEKVADTPLDQQSPGILPGYDDEAIQIGLDAALGKLYGDQAVRILGSIRGSLKPFQCTQWRKSLTSLKVTERHETIETSRRTKRQEAAGNRPASEETVSEFARVQKDYEYTAKDPRVMHLKLVVDMAGTPPTPASIRRVKQYLLVSGFITEKSATDKAAEAVSSAIDKGVDGVYHIGASLALGDLHSDIVDDPNMSAKDKARGVAIALDWQAAHKRQQLAALKARPRVPMWLAGLMVITVIFVILIILGTTGLWYYTNWGA